MAEEARTIRRHHLQESRKCVALSSDNDGVKKKKHTETQRTLSFTLNTEKQFGTSVGVFGEKRTL